MNDEFVRKVLSSQFSFFSKFGTRASLLRWRSGIVVPIDMGGLPVLSEN